VRVCECVCHGVCMCCVYVCVPLNTLIAGDGYIVTCDVSSFDPKQVVRVALVAMATMQAAEDVRTILGNSKLQVCVCVCVRVVV